MDMPVLPGADEMTADLVKKVSGYFPMLGPLRKDLMELTRERMSFPPGHTIVSAGDRYDSIYLIEEGWVLRSRFLPGGGRQIVNVALPGDFLCFNAMMFRTSEFDLTTRTNCSVFRLKAPDIDRLLEDHKGLAAALMWANAQEESLLAERVVSLGRRDALERLAHVICEIASRLEMIERHSGDVLTIPLIQEDFADILGLSSIHVTRTFRKLSELGAVDYRSGRLRLNRMDILRRVAGFERDYLHFTQRNDRIPVP